MGVGSRSQAVPLGGVGEVQMADVGRAMYGVKRVWDGEVVLVVKSI